MFGHMLYCIGGWYLDPDYWEELRKVQEEEQSKIKCPGCDKEYTRKEAEMSEFVLFYTKEKGHCKKCGMKLV